MMTIDTGTNTETGGPIFGTRVAGAVYVVRPGAYAIMRDEAGLVAVVDTPLGRFLPGGGIDEGESVEEAVVREVREECGLDVRARGIVTRAVELLYAAGEATYFEKRCVFVAIDRSIGQEAGVAGSGEADHELRWVKLDEAARTLAHASQRWAVAQCDACAGEFHYFNMPCRTEDREIIP